MSGTPQRRHVNGNGSRNRGSRNGHPPTPLERITNLGHKLPRSLRRGVEMHPEVMLAGVGGASFLAGAILGSRLGRAILAAAIPLGIQYLLESEIGPRLRSYVEVMKRNLDGAPDSKS